jgi:hypothetical protein
VIQNNWLFSRPVLDPNGSRLSITTVISLSMILIALLSAAWLGGRVRRPDRSFRFDPNQKRFFMIFALVSGMVLFLQTPVSLPVWNLLPKLRFLEFPFRWLAILDAPMAILFAAAVWPGKAASFARRASAIAVCAVLLVVSIIYANHSFFRACEPSASLEELVSAYRTGTGFWGAEENAPPGSDNSTVPVSLPPACFTTDPAVNLNATHAPNANPVWRAGQSACEAIGDFTLQQPEHLRIATIAPRPGFAILRLRSYPAWLVTVDGRPVTSFPARIDGLMAVPVPKGAVQIEAQWRNPAGVAAGWLISIAALVLCAVLVAINRRRRAEQ